MNRRIIYNRASADPEGKPWSERKRYVWWDEEEGKWIGEDVPDFEETKRPDYEPPDDARGPDAIRGDHPFIMQPAGRGWLFAAQRGRRRAAADALRAARVAVRQPALLGSARIPRARSSRAVTTSMRRPRKTRTRTS